jgi:heptosyltransferase I
MKILIIKLSALGDIVHTIPAFNALVVKYPDAQIDWLVYKSFAPILESQKALKQIIKLENKKFSSLLRVSKQLKKQNYDLIIDFQGLIKTALLARLISPNTRGFKQPREKIAALCYKEKIDAGNIMQNDRHIVERNLLLARHPEPEGRQDLPFANLQQKHSPKNKLCIIPSTTWQTKLWQAGRWAQLIDIVKKNKPETQIYILGTIKDLLVIEEIICQTKSPLHIVVNKSLQELPEFFSEMSTVIGVDTGPLHIAAASLYGSKAQVIGLYGPSSGARSGPYGFKYISVDEFTDHQAYNKRKDDDSMKLVSVGQVWDVINGAV